MDEIAADHSHPRYQSLLMRHRIEIAAKEGLLADSAMIAHGRGEAFDYLLGEQTIPSAMNATKLAYRCLAEAKKPVISLNGNTVALVGKEIMMLAAKLNCPVEINIFYRTAERMEKLFSRLDNIRTKEVIDVEILGMNPNAKIPGLEGPRANCCREGILNSDVILVPLEDGDRCEALVAMGKTVIVIDLNPLSRSAKRGTLTIVDELSRVVNNMLDFAEPLSEFALDDWDNKENLKQALKHINDLIQN